MQGKVTLKSISPIRIHYVLLYGLTFISLSHLLHSIRNALTLYCVWLVAPPTLISSVAITSICNRTLRQNLHYDYNNASGTKTCPNRIFYVEHFWCAIDNLSSSMQKNYRPTCKKMYSCEKYEKLYAKIVRFYNL